MEKRLKESNELSSTTECTFFARPSSTAGSSAQLKLLYSGLQDLADTWDKLHFVVTPVRLLREVVGDGLNDAPVLAAASVSVAMGAGASPRRRAPTLC